MIYKIEQAFHPPMAPWMVYDYGKHMTIKVPFDLMPPEIVVAMGSDAKGYFDIRGIDHGSPNFKFKSAKRIPDQDW